MVGKRKRLEHELGIDVELDIRKRRKLALAPESLEMVVFTQRMTGWINNAMKVELLRMCNKML